MGPTKLLTVARRPDSPGAAHGLGRSAPRTESGYPRGGGSLRGYAPSASVNGGPKSTATWSPLSISCAIVGIGRTSCWMRNDISFFPSYSLGVATVSRISRIVRRTEAKLLARRSSPGERVQARCVKRACTRSPAPGPYRSLTRWAGSNAHRVCSPGRAVCPSACTAMLARARLLWTPVPGSRVSSDRSS